MADDKVTLEIDINAKDAQRELDAFGSKASQSLNKAQSGISSFANSFKSLAGPIAAAAASFATLQKSISEAVEADKAIKQLSFAIASTGEFSQAAVEGLTAYANELSKITGIDDDVIVGSLALAKTFGITNEQAKNLVTAASNLSAVTGQDLETAIRQLGGTFDGTLGKVANLGPEFRNLTEEQIKNGAAIDLINEKYAGASAALGDSFEGGLNRLQNAFNDVFKAIGQEIINDPDIINGINIFASGLISLASVAGKTARIIIDAMKDVVSVIALASATVTDSLSGIASFVGLDTVSKNIDGLTESAYKTVEAMGAFGTITKDVGSSFEANLVKTSAAASKGIESTGKAALKAADDFKKAQDEAQKFITSLVTVSGNAVEVAAKKAGEAFEKITGLEEKGLISFEQAQEARLAVVSEVNEKILKDTTDRLNAEIKAEDDYQRNLERAKRDTDALRAETEKGFIQTASIVGEAFSAALSGGDEKQRFRGIGSVLSASLTAAFGPLGGIFGGLATQLSQLSKDQTKQFIRDFIDSVPDFVIAVVENIPYIVQGLAEALSRPGFWIDIVRALGVALRVIVVDLVVSILEAFFKPLRDSFAPLTDALQSLQSALQPLTDAVTALKDATDKAGGVFGSGGGKGVVRETFERVGIKFAEGGVVPKYAANGLFVPQGTDTVPAMLTPGELVVPRDMVGSLGAFLQEQDKPSQEPGMTEAILTSILQVLSQPQNVETKVTLNQQAFADIILQLNRQNMRLSA